MTIETNPTNPQIDGAESPENIRLMTNVTRSLGRWMDHVISVKCDGIASKMAEQTCKDIAVESIAAHVDLSEVAKLVAAEVESNVDMDEIAENVSNLISVDDVAGSIDMDTLAENLVSNFDEAGIASSIDMDELAEHMEDVEPRDVAEYIDASDIADHIDMDDLAAHVAMGMDDPNGDEITKLQARLKMLENTLSRRIVRRVNQAKTWLVSLVSKRRG